MENNNELGTTGIIEDFDKLMLEKIEKLNQIKEKGINPYPYSYLPTNNSQELIENYQEGQKVCIAGRIMSMRKMGGASFGHIQDAKGKIQVYFNKNELGEEIYTFLKLLDIGDIVGIEGTMMKTKTEEITVRVSKIELLTKSIRPLPEKYHGLTDSDLRYRHRSLDMIMNPVVKETLEKRSKAVKAIRDLLTSKGCFEMETPILNPKYGGDAAKPFVTHYNALNHDAYLNIAPELYLKRLIVGGIENVFYLGKCFRNEGIDRTHSPEFTSLEIYMSYKDYNDIMKLVEEIYQHVFLTVNGSTKINYQGVELDFKAPWARVRIVDITKQYTNIDVENLSKEEILLEMKNKNLSLEGVDDPSNLCKGELILNLFENYGEKQIVQPTFIIDYPKESSPLCKLHRENSDYIERSEPFVNGIEIGNLYSELNDPIRQRNLLEEQSKEAKLQGKEEYPLDEEFLTAIDTGMPPTGGVGLGIDRMIMFLTNSYSIKDVIPFIFMKNLK